MRHSQRLKKILRILGKAPNESVPKASQSITDAQSIYRFWSNKQVTPSQILASHRPRVVERAQEHKVVLAIQDTTDLDFTNLKATTGLGFIGGSHNQGVKVHSCIAVSGTGAPLGLLHQYSWNRTERSGQRAQRRKKSTKAKESQRWLDTLSAAEKGFNDGMHMVHVGDREADIFDLFVQPRRANSDLLIRLSHNRKVTHELGYLHPTIEQGPVLGQYTLEIERTSQRRGREATLTVQAMEVTLEVPHHHLKRSQYQSVTVHIIRVKEENPLDGGKPIEWLLLTTLPIEDFEQVRRYIYWYSLRWLIERFHYTLKSGCGLEDLQLDSLERLLNALATYSIVAWRVMWLTYQARLTPDASCQTILESCEWRLLRRKFEPKNRSKKPPTIRQAVRWIAQLGGFLARKGDGEPGLKTVWRGLGALRLLLEGAQLNAKT